VYQVTPLDADAPWRKGRQVVSRDSGGVSLAVSFERSRGGYLAFDVAIVNYTGSTIRVDPRDFHYTLELTPAVPGHDPRVRYTAMDPEAEILRIDRRASTQRAQHEARATFDVVTDLVEVVADLSEPGPQDSDEAGRGAVESDAESEVRFFEDASHERTLRDLARERRYWASRALRRTHLAHAEAIAGTLSLPGAPIRRAREGDFRGGNRLSRPAGWPAAVECTLTLHARVGGVNHEVAFLVREP
jgi:hypothetical protein